MEFFSRFLFVIIGFFAVLNPLFGQNVLEFSSAKFLQIHFVIPFNVVPATVYKDTVIVVPANKIWKIEAVSCGDSLSSAVAGLNWGNKTAVYLNNKHIYSGEINATHVYQTFPIWLPQGSYKLRFIDHTGNASAQVIYHFFFVNITEWNTKP